MPTCVLPPEDRGRGRRKLPVVDYPADVKRPRTRGECVEGPRPCPWVSCRYHLAIDLTRAGKVRVDTRGQKMPHTCALDVAAEGEHTIAEVGAVIGMTRMGATRIEKAALRKLRKAGAALKDLIGTQEPITTLGTTTPGGISVDGH